MPDIDNSQSVLYKGQKFSIEQTDQFFQWLNGLRDRSGRDRVSKRLRRLADGNFGDCKPVGDGVMEARMFFGPGYRVYYMFRGNVVILLLAGGDKDSQPRDIASAKELAREERDGAEDDSI